MRGKLNIFYVSPEVSPFAKFSDLGDVAAAFAKYTKNLGHDIRIMMPNYKLINERKYTLRDVIRLQGLELKVGDKSHEANGKSSFIPNSKVQVYFLDNKHYFDQEDFESENGKKAEIAERFIFFSKGCLETLKLLHWQPDIIHCNEWQTALIPFFLKSIYKDDPFFHNTRTLLSIHDFGHRGEFDAAIAEKTGLQQNGFYANDTEHKFSFLKTGLQHADLVNTVSETYAREVLENSELNDGVSRILKKRKDQFVGIINGVDYDIWNPESDSLITAPYNRRTVSVKLENKKELLGRFNLEFSEKTPIIGMISRMTDEKGFDLLAKAFEQLMQIDLQLILLGVGDKKYQKIFKEFAKKFPKKFSFESDFDEKLAHMMFAGCDMYLMPSRFEPCGLHQMYSLKYGTVPIARKTGGLMDTIRELDHGQTESATGFMFNKYSAAELLRAVKNAVKMYRDEALWSKLVQNGMKQDFSWKTPAQKYIKLYQKIMNLKNSKK